MYLDKHSVKRKNEAKILGGLFIIGFGVIFLLERMGMAIPDWAISWQTILIAVGIVTLYKHNFRHFPGYILILIGIAFLIKDIQPNAIDTKIVLPIVVISFGIMMIGKATNLFNSKKKRSQNVIFEEDTEISSEDFVRSTTVFGGTTKNIVSKDFKGGDFKTVFGGTEINLTKADIKQPVVIESNSVFAGLTLIVPSNWQVRSEVNTVLGSVEDKRGINPGIVEDPNKILILKGGCVFGGIEIQSYI